MKTKSKIQKYERLFEQLSELLKESNNLLTQYSTINAILYHKIDYISWVGFYIYSSDKLTVGPYQGPLACQELQYHQGVCWHTVINRTSVIVPDVSQFIGHIACDSKTKSEITLPVYNAQNKVIAILDIDSCQLNAFDEIDKEGLEKIVSLISE